MRIALRGAAALLLAIAPAASAPDPRIVVGPNVHVSGTHRGVNHNETVIAAHPREPGVLLGCSMLGLAPGRRSAVAAYRSADGGRSWRLAVRSTGHFAGDPSCGFDGEGRAWLSAKTNDRQPQPGTWASDADSLAVWWSADGGATWALPRRVLQANDRPWLAADPGGGTVYAVYDGHEHRPGGGHANVDFRHLLVLAASPDGGRSFPRVVARALPGQTTDQQHASLAGGIVVLSDGTVLALQHHMVLGGPSGDGGKLRELGGTLDVYASRDRGATLDSVGSLGAVVSAYNAPASRGVTGAIVAGPRRAGLREPVYVVWTDYASGHGVIRFAASPDAGRTWSSASSVAPGPASDADRFMPAVAVNREGVIGVLWYDRGGVADGEDYLPRFSASLDGGATWMASVALSTSPNARRQQRAGASGTYLPNGGDTAGLATDLSGRFHALWIDNRTGVQQAWTSAIEVRAGRR